MIPEYQQRVMGEYTDLTSKMAKLTAFLADTDKINTTSLEQRLMMFDQLAHMNSYAKVLHARLVEFGLFPI